VSNRSPNASTRGAAAPPPSRKLVSQAAAAAYIGCHVRTIRRRIADGSLTGYRMGPRLIRVDLHELDAIMRPMPTAGSAV